MRKAAPSPEDSENNFVKFETIAQYNVQDHDIDNKDQSGFKIRCLGGHFVYTRSDQKGIYMADPENYKCLTQMECVNILKAGH